jgi:SAM-dependent methyltransferase
MSGSHVPERLRWAVEQLGIAPDEEILEIGPGAGASAALVCERLATGRITGIDRSAVAIQRATKRNASHVAAGKAVFHQLDLADVGQVRRALSGQRFDKVFAVNVNLFWVRPADAELRLIRNLLGPDGVVCLVYETPGREQANRVAEAVAAALTTCGFATTVTTASSPTLLCVTGRLTSDA